MAAKRPKTIPEYIKAAPPAGQAHARKLYAILKKVAPKAEQVIKWGNPFFIEPRFLFAFSTHKAHISFAPMQGALKPFKKELVKHQTTTHFLKIPYAEPLPAALITKIARHCVKTVKERKGDGFW